MLACEYLITQLDVSILIAETRLGPFPVAIFNHHAGYSRGVGNLKDAPYLLNKTCHCPHQITIGHFNILSCLNFSPAHSQWKQQQVVRPTA